MNDLSYLTLSEAAALLPKPSTHLNYSSLANAWLEGAFLKNHSSRRKTVHLPRVVRGLLGTYQQGWQILRIEISEAAISAGTNQESGEADIWLISKLRISRANKSPTDPGGRLL